MGWGDCGFDSKGHPIGYVFSATCDHDGCNKEIDRGLSYTCGGMHGETEFGCEKYFCDGHLRNFVDDDGDLIRVCDSCAKELLDSGEWCLDKNEGIIVQVKEGE